MRKLMWFTIGFGISCGICAWFRVENFVLPLIVFGTAAVCSIRRKPWPGELLCLGLCLGMLWCSIFHTSYLQIPMHADGTTVTCSISVTDYSWKSDYGTVADGTIELGGNSYAVRFYCNENMYLMPGDTVSGEFRLRYTPGGEDAATFHGGRGIFLLAYQRGDLTRGVRSLEDWEAIGARVAYWIKQRLGLLFSGEDYAFVKALLLGDSSDLNYETNTALKLSGIRHIIAVSGLHVMLLYGLIDRITLQNKWLTALFCLPVLAVFSAVAGFSPSVTRASLMAAMMITARLFNREYDPPSALSFSALVMLLYNPMVITSVSFQLTVGCVAGMQLFSGPIKEWLKWRWKIGKKGLKNRIKALISGSVSVTLGAMSLTTPLVALYFGSVSLAGIFSNLLLLWLVTLIFHGSVLVVLVSLGSLSWAYTIAKVLVWPIRLLLSTAKFLGNLPLASVFTASPYVALWLVFVYVLLVLFLFAPRKMPGRLLICGLTGLILSLVLSWAEPRMDDCRVTMLDVGQGQSILLQSRGSTYLVDCGGSSDTDTADVIAETLLSQGIRAIDGVILTHMDRDHTGALSLLRTRIRVGSVYTPDPDADGILVQKVKMISCGSGEITIIGGNFPEDDQENGLCVLFEAGNCAILITGDRSGLGEMMLMESYPLPNVDLLIAGHHGSAYSTSDRLLQLVQPDTVFISAGKDNAYGHPADALLTRLESYGCQVFRTDLQGTLLYRR